MNCFGWKDNECRVLKETAFGDYECGEMGDCPFYKPRGIESEVANINGKLIRYGEYYEQDEE